GAGADHLAAERLHAEHLGLGVPPVSRRAAAFFLCHFPCSLTSDGADLQFGELLAMPLALLVVLATPHLEDANLVVLAVSHNGGFHSCAGHQGSTHLVRFAVDDGEHLVEHDFLAYVRSNLFYFNFFAGSNAILLATGFYDRVHVDLLGMSLSGRIPGEPAMIA